MLADAPVVRGAQVTHVEPWMSGNARGPSTAFCVLHRFFEMKLTARQVRTLLQHEDSPYIRAVRGGAAPPLPAARRRAQQP